jgi:hypothetical protein
MPSSSHFIFIPAVLMFGMLLGFILGSRAAADRANLERKREEERARARAERAARKKKAAGDDEAAEAESKEAS